MIVISRNGQTTVVTGWKAWLLGAVIIGAAWLLLAVIVFAWIGAAITLGAILLLAVPAFVIAAIVRSWVRRGNQ